MRSHVLCPPTSFLPLRIFAFRGILLIMQSSSSQFLSTAPHFYGLIVAIIGLVALIIWMRRGRTKELPARRRRLIAASVLAGLVILGWFGNGVYGHAARGLLPPLRIMGLPSHMGDEIAAATSRALDVALSDEFIRYLHGLHARPVTFSGKELRQRLHVRRARYADLSTYGLHMSPPPPADMTFHLYEYYDTVNFGLYLLGLGEQEMNGRSTFVDLVQHEIEELVVLELLRGSQSDEDRLVALRVLSAGLPSLAEWTRRDLRRFSEQELSGEVTRKVHEVLAHVQQYIDEPRRRGFAASVDLAD